MIIFKKLKSKSPECQNVTTTERSYYGPLILAHLTPQIPQNRKEDLDLKLFDKIEKIPQLQLNEFITLKKIKTTINNGVLKRMLHVPTFRIFDLLVIITTKYWLFNI